MRIGILNPVKVASLAAILLFALNILVAAPVSATTNNSPNHSQSTSVQSPISQFAQANTPNPNQQNQTQNQTQAQNQSAVQEEDNAVLRPGCEASVPGVGWILCQAGRLLYGVFDFLLNTVEDNLLRIDLIDDQSSLQAAWAGFRTVANLIFAVAFIVIIYAEASGRFGALESYSVTKIMPRLVVSVIGIQLSYFIVAYLIALFNDIGAGAGQLALAPVAGTSGFEVGNIFSELTENSFFGLDIAATGFDNILLAIGLGVAAIGTLVFFESVLLFAGLGLLLLVLTLIARKVIVVVLVVLAPIAFAAYVLPGTQKLFSLWWDTLTKTLMMYPLIMVFIAAGQLVARVTISASPGEVSFVDSMIAMIAAFMPFFLIPATFKFAGAAVGAIAGGLGNFNEKLKGDIRDPNSLRSSLKQRRGQRYGRLMSGQMRVPGAKGVPIVPNRVRRAYNRLPGVDSAAPLMADIAEGRKSIETLTSTLGDDFVRAMAVTGGGRRSGPMVRTADGGRFNAGVLKQGKHFAYNADGSIATSNGIAQLIDEEGNRSDVTSSNFYDASTMSQVSKFSNNRGIQHAAGEYTMRKSQTRRDQNQVWAGLDSTSWTADEKTIMANSIWYATKGDNLHNKFSDFGGYFGEGKQSFSAPKDMGFKFGSAIEYIARNEGSYELSKQKGAFWETMSTGLGDFATSNNLGEVGVAQNHEAIRQRIGNKQFDEVTDIARKALNVVNQDRQVRGAQPQRNEDGEIEGYAVGSQATGEAARNAVEYLRQYEQYFGRLPGADPVINQVQPAQPGNDDN